MVETGQTKFERPKKDLPLLLEEDIGGRELKLGPVEQLRMRQEYARIENTLDKIFEGHNTFAVTVAFDDVTVIIEHRTKRKLDGLGPKITFQNLGTLLGTPSQAGTELPDISVSHTHNHPKPLDRFRMDVKFGSSEPQSQEYDALVRSKIIGQCLAKVADQLQGKTAEGFREVVMLGEVAAYIKRIELSLKQAAKDKAPQVKQDQRFLKCETDVPYSTKLFNLDTDWQRSSQTDGKGKPSGLINPDTIDSIVEATKSGEPIDLRKVEQPNSAIHQLDVVVYTPDPGLTVELKHNYLSPENKKRVELVTVQLAEDGSVQNLYTQSNTFDGSPGSHTRAVFGNLNSLQCLHQAHQLLQALAEDPISPSRTAMLDEAFGYEMVDEDLCMIRLGTDAVPLIEAEISRENQNQSKDYDSSHYLEQLNKLKVLLSQTDSVVGVDGELTGVSPDATNTTLEDFGDMVELRDENNG